MVAAGAVLKMEAAEFDTHDEHDRGRIGGREGMGDAEGIERSMAAHEADMGAGHGRRQAEGGDHLQVDAGIGEARAGAGHQMGDCVGRDACLGDCRPGGPDCQRPGLAGVAIHPLGGRGAGVVAMRRRKKKVLGIRGVAGFIEQDRAPGADFCLPVDGGERAFPARLRVGEVDGERGRIGLGDLPRRRGGADGMQCEAHTEQAPWPRRLPTSNGKRGSAIQGAAAATRIAAPTSHGWRSTAAMRRQRR